MWFDLTEFRRVNSYAACSECHNGVAGFSRWHTHTIDGQFCEHITSISLSDFAQTPYQRRMVQARDVRMCGCGLCRTLIVDPVPASERAGFDHPVALPRSFTDIADQLVRTSLCPDCNTFSHGDDMPETFHVDRNVNGYSGEVCATCYHRPGVYRPCQDCEEAIVSSGAYTIRTNGDGTRVVCPDCQEDNWSLCGHCGYMYSSNGECCGDPEDLVDGCDCRECRTQRRTSIRNYSFKPKPVFHVVGDGSDVRTGQDRYRREFDGTPYMGFELEMEVSGREDRYAVASQVIAGMGGPKFAYAKEDGSINHGFELVSHPATLDYLMTKVDWSILRELRTAKKISSSDNCGLHIHVSKAGFSGKAHEYRWLLFWYRNQEVMIALAGRDSYYARFDEETRGQLRRAVTENTWRQRYTAINTNNEHTHEVRAFASTLYVNRLRAALQLVESTVEYTRQLGVAKVLKDGGFSWAEYVVWLSGQSARYRDLLKRIDQVVTDKVVRARPRVASVRHYVGNDRYGDAVYDLKSTVMQEVINRRERIAV